MRRLGFLLVGLLLTAAPAVAQIGVPGQATPQQTMQVGGSNGGALFTVPGDGTNGFFVQVKNAALAQLPSALVGGRLDVNVGNTPAFTISGTLPAFASTPTVNLGGTLPAFASTPAFTISGTLPAFTSTPTFNVGTTNGLFLDATYTGRTPAGASPANGESNTNTALSRIGVFNFVYNGSTWDRWTGAVTGTVTANAGSGVFGTNLSQVGGSAFALGQQLAAASLPMVLTASQLTTLTPPTTITANAGTGSFTVAQATGTNLHMTCDSGCSTSTAPADNSAFTASTTSSTPVSGFYHATVDTVTDGRIAAIAIDSHRSLHGSLFDTGGTAITDSTAHAEKVLSVDATGAVIAPTTLATHDGALTPASTTGSLFMGRASAAAPTGVSADDDAVLPWFLRNGSQVVNLAAGGTLITATSTSLNANLTGGTTTVTQGTGTNLHMVCDSGCSTSAGFADNGAFTFGTTAVNPIAGVFDDVSSNTATENSAAIVRITQNKGLHINLRNASGTEIGTSANPVQMTLANTGANATAVKVDNSAVTQPVSGTVTANIGTTNGLFLDATFTGRMPAGASPANAESNTNTALSRIGGYNFIFNGTTWDRWTGAVSQATAANLNATVVGTGTFVTQSTLAAETTKVIGTARILGNAGAIFDQATGSAVPANALYQGVNVAGNIRGWTAVNPSGSIFAGQVDLASVAGATIAQGHGTAAAAIRVELPTDGTGIVGLAAGTNAIGSVIHAAATSGGATPSNYISAASNNSTNLKATAGTVYSAVVINNTATEKFIRFYDSASAPTCTSATGMVFYSPIPANSTTGAGFVVPMPVGANFASGIGWCITGAAGTTDNTSTAAGDVVMNVTYK